MMKRAVSVRLRSAAAPHLGAERRSLVHACIGCADIFDFRCCDLLYASGAVGKGLKVQKNIHAIFSPVSV